MTWSGFARTLCRTVITHDHYRFVEVPDPDRGSDRERDAAEYQRGVEVWHDARARRYAEIIGAEIKDGGTVGFLVWGDPAIYDSTIRVVQSITTLGVDLELTVIPGISSIQRSRRGTRSSSTESAGQST